MIKRFSRILFLGFLFVLILKFSPLAGCGAAPPAGIPAPVANLMNATTPAGSPLTTTVSGAAGSVQANSTVTVANLSQGGSTTQLRKNYFIKNAFAQTAPFVQVNADNQGAFTAPPLPANPGNNDIAIRYRNPLGEISEELVIVIPCGPPGSPAACQVFQLNP